MSLRMFRRGLVVTLTGLALTALPLIAAPSADAAGRHDPVVTVYGFAGASQAFDPIKSELVTAGWPKDAFHDFGYIGTNSNVQIATELKAYVDNVKKETGASKVDLLVHSMGAISSRYYLKFLGGSTSVDAWIALGGADQGTTYAPLSLCAPFFAACADMVPGSPILTALNSGDPTPGTTRYYTHYSSCDGVIVPFTNILVDTATNTPVEPCVGHNDYFSNASVQRLVQQELG
jgi:triacylglycerol esterase/lipase EstA (alpha/beta hydrolase family)